MQDFRREYLSDPLREADKRLASGRDARPGAALGVVDGEGVGELKAGEAFAGFAVGRYSERPFVRVRTQGRAVLRVPDLEHGPYDERTKELARRAEVYAAGPNSFTGRADGNTFVGWATHLEAPGRFIVAFDLAAPERARAAFREAGRTLREVRA